MSRFAQRMMKAAVQPTGGGSGVTLGAFPHADVGSDPVGSTTYTVPGGALFVATNGNDTTGDGTQADPYATLAKAVAVATAGKTIVIRAGTYSDGGHTQSGSATSGIVINKALTIQNYPNEAVWFDGSRAATSWTSSGGLWSTSYDRVFDRTPSGTRGQSDTQGWVNGSYPLAPWPDMVLYDGTQLTPVATKAEVGPGKFWVEGSGGTSAESYWFTATKVWIGDNPSGHTVRVSNLVRLLTVQSTSNCTIRGIGVRRYSNSNPDTGVITTVGANNLLENIWMEDISDDGISMQGSVSVDGSNQIGRKLTVLRAGHLGTQGYMADNLTYDRIDVRDANLHMWNYAPQAGATKIVKCQTVTVKNSSFRDTMAKGLWFDQTVANPNVIGCYFDNIDDIAIKIECSTEKGLVANCVFTNCRDHGVQVNNSDKVAFWNCTFSATGQNASRPISYEMDSRRSYNFATNKDQRQPDSYYDDPANQWQINHVDVHNCVIASPPSGTNGMLAVDDHERSSSNDRGIASYNLNINTNLYQWITKPTYPWIYPSISSGSGSLRTSQTLTDFQTKTGQDTNSTLVTGSAVLDSSERVTNQAYHAGATALPAAIATSIGQSTGTKYMGAFIA